MSRSLWFVDLLKKAFPGRFLLARSTKVPILGGILDRWLFENDDLFYLPKNQAILINQQIQVPDEIVLPSQVVEHFIQRANVHWIMDACICRQATRCEDYPINYGCLFLGDAALGINPGLGRQVTRDEALEHVHRCREAGLVHLVGRTKLDTIWLGVSPGTKLLTICNCCPCCCLWKILPHTTPKISKKITRMPGVTVAVSDRCVGCGTCNEDVCFVSAIDMVDGYSVISAACRGCGRCVTLCPEGAIEIDVETDRFVEKSIDRISALVDLS